MENTVYYKHNKTQYSVTRKALYTLYRTTAYYNGNPVHLLHGTLYRAVHNEN